MSAADLAIELARALAVSVGVFGTVACCVTLADELFVGKRSHRAVVAIVGTVALTACGILIRWGLS